MLNKNEMGYVALEFVLAMGLLVLPTALILLQIPGYLEKADRTKAIASQVAFVCANQVSEIEDSNSIASSTAISEINSSSILNNEELSDASCTYETREIQPGSKVQSNVSITVSSPIIPGLSSNVQWTIHKSHIAIVPKYRSFDSK